MRAIDCWIVDVPSFGRAGGDADAGKPCDGEVAWCVVGAAGFGAWAGVNGAANVGLRGEGSRDGISLCA